MTQILATAEPRVMNASSLVFMKTPPDGSDRNPPLGTRAAAGRQSGFVITTTMVVVFTIVFIGLLVGLSAVKNAWFKKTAFETSVDVFVMTDAGQVLGKAVDFDEHEAPLVPFVDYDVPAVSGGNYRVLVGVRDDRFTSRERVYYPNSLNCTGQPCIFVPSTEVSGNTSVNSRGVDEITGTGGVSYQLATQAGGGVGTRYNYAIGSSDGGLPGHLLRQTETNCVINIPDPSQDTYISYWQSQRVVEEGGTDSGGGTNPPCYQELFAKAAIIEDLFLRCQGGWATNNCCHFAGKELPSGSVCPTDPSLVCLDNPPGNCNCPPGYSSADNQAGWCCPDESSALPSGQCQQLAQTFFLPEAGDFIEALSVGNPNVLDGLETPFKVNLPINPEDFEAADPPVGGE